MGMGYKREREPQVSLQKALDLIERLDISNKDFISFCGLKSMKQWTRWSKRGTMPEYRLIVAQNALRKHFDKDYHDKIRIINGEEES